MKIAVTKVFVNYLNSLAKRGFLQIDHAELKSYSPKEYEWRVGVDATLDADSYGDYDYDDDGNLVYKAIEVVYPYEFHACPKYLTTELLTTICRWNCGVNSEERLIEKLKDLINI